MAFPQNTNWACLYSFYNFRQQPQRILAPPMEVLDLSRRCDSVETHKTPSPCNSTSSFGTVSPSTNFGSPPNSTQTATPTPLDLSVSTVRGPVIRNKFDFSQLIAPPPPQRIASLYPLYRAILKEEVGSPTVSPVMPNSLSLHLPSSADILQQSHNKNTHPLACPSPESENQKCSTPTSFVPAPTTTPHQNTFNAGTTGTSNLSKATRPFNAFPPDPKLVAAHFVASDEMLQKKTNIESYDLFRKRMLSDILHTNGGQRIVSNPKMRRTNNRCVQSIESKERAMESSDNDSSNGNGSSVEHSNKNDTNNNNNDCNHSSSNSGRRDAKSKTYYERRRKNNAAAKRSRDRRRIKQDELAIRTEYLQRQNIQLLQQIDLLQKELESFTKA